MYWLHVHYHSEILRMPVQMEVLLPESSDNPNKPYTALYLLHDMGAGHTSWLRKTNIENYIEELSYAVVMPMGHLGYYTDMYYGKDYFTFITEELPAICERMFPLSEERVIAGYGIGGYGALKAGMFASSKFKIAAAFSSLIDINSIARGMEPNDLLDIFGPKADWKGSNNDLYAAEVESSPTKFYISCDGKSGLLQENLNFSKHLLSLGLAHTMRETRPISNQWIQLDDSLKNFIGWLADK